MMWWMPCPEPSYIIRCTTCSYHQLWSKQAAKSKMEEKKRGKSIWWIEQAVRQMTEV